MKTNIKFRNIFASLAIVLSTLFVVSCNDDDNFDDVVPDYAEAIIRTCTIAGESASIDHNDATISMTMPAGSDLTALSVEMSTPEGTSVSPESGSVVDFSAGPVIFKTTAANGANREYTATIVAYGDPKITSFKIGAREGVIDYNDNTIKLEIGSQDGDITSLTPTFEITQGCSVDKPSGVSQNFTNPVIYTVLSNDGYTAVEFSVIVSQIAAPSVTTFALNGYNGVIDNSAATIAVTIPASMDISNIVANITLPAGQTADITGVAKDYNSPVTFVVTNAEGIEKTYTVTVTKGVTQYAFLGEAASVETLADDDAKAAAEWMQTTYGKQFKYIQISTIDAIKLSDVKVAMLYYLTSAEGTYSASPTNIQTMLPTDLREGTPQTTALTAWVKSGGDLLLAGDATSFVFNTGRVPADYSQPKASGNYLYGEFGNGSLETGKSDTDIWGLGIKNIASPNENAVLSHKAFEGLTLSEDKYISLTNAADREVRLIWYTTFDGVIVNGCGVDAVTAAEARLNMLRLGSLRHIGDGFGYGMIEWLPTTETTPADMDSQITKDYQGTIFSIENTIIGYEWDANGGTNDYQSNIEKMTKNILEYLFSLE